jgi:hypothetical protein
VGKPSAMNSSDTSVPGRWWGTNGGRQGSKAVVGNAGADCATCGGSAIDGARRKTSGGKGGARRKTSKGRRMPDGQGTWSCGRPTLCT